MLVQAAFPVSPALTPALCRGKKAPPWIKFAISPVHTSDLDHEVTTPLWVTRLMLATAS